MKRLVSLAAVSVIACVFAATANAWDANVAAIAKCNVQTGLFDVTASVVSSNPAGAVIKSYTPTTFPGNTTGSQKVYITVDWPNNNEEPTYTKYVTLNGTCVKVCEPVVIIKEVPGPERIVYVDRPAPPAPPAVVTTTTVTNTITTPAKPLPVKPCKAPKGRKVKRGKDGNCYVTVVKVKIVKPKPKIIRIKEECVPPPPDYPGCEGKCDDIPKGQSG